MAEPIAAAPAETTSSDLGQDRVDDLLGGDWPLRATDTIERVVDQVRAKTTGPAVVVSRVVVYGLVAFFAGIIAAVLVLIALVRLADVAIPGEVWSAYLVLGALFGIIGLILWTRRPPRS